MANGTIVKYKKSYTITIDGKTDTKHPEDTPMYLSTFEKVLHGVVEMLDRETKSNTVTIKENEL